MHRHLHAIVAGLMTLLLAGCASAPRGSAVDAAALSGSQWRALQINGQPASERPPTTLRFASATQVTGHGGCNNYFGKAQFGADGVQLGPPAATRRACPSAIQQQEDAWFKLLEEVRSLRLDKGSLLLLDARRGVIARMVRHESPAP